MQGAEPPTLGSLEGEASPPQEEKKLKIRARNPTTALPGNINRTPLETVLTDNPRKLPPIFALPWNQMGTCFTMLSLFLSLTKSFSSISDVHYFTSSASKKDFFFLASVHIIQREAALAFFCTAAVIVRMTFEV
ncbi:unnamed protein product [Eretmochelys imbricata]